MPSKFIAKMLTQSRARIKRVLNRRSKGGCAAQVQQAACNLVETFVNLKRARPPRTRSAEPDLPSSHRFTNGRDGANTDGGSRVRSDTDKLHNKDMAEDRGACNR